MSYPSALTGYPVNPPPLVGPVCFPHHLRQGAALAPPRTAD
jgi:hypothetical protein